jgi:hypothetical protein
LHEATRQILGLLSEAKSSCSHGLVRELPGAPDEPQAELDFIEQELDLPQA